MDGHMTVGDMETGCINGEHYQEHLTFQNRLLQVVHICKTLLVIVELCFL